MKIAILGFAVEGEVSFKFFNHPDNQITICDKNSELKVPDNVPTRLGPEYLSNLDGFDLLVRSPGLPPSAITAANPNSPNILDKVTSSLNEFFKASPTKNIIGITGTKGKGTTSTLVTKMLEASGLKVHLGGNIGIPPLEILDNQISDSDWVVLELSSFQLIDIKYSPHMAICLMVVPEHLDWHKDDEEYFRAKSQLFSHQKDTDIAIYYANNEKSKMIAEASPGEKIPYMSEPGAYVKDDQIVINDQVIIETNKIKLLGKHNWQNICAAITAVWQVNQDIGSIRSVLSSFTGLEHRLELVRELGGVKYFDDSFGTTPETAIVAIEAIKEPKVMILGGSDKNAQYNNLAEAVAKGNIKHVVAIGQTANKIRQALVSKGFKHISDGGDNIQQIVEEAKNHADQGDAVLLSPACASFGLFKDYKDRGEQFKRTVEKL